MGCTLCKSGHDLPFATPDRTPPDPSLFPRYLQNAQGLWLRYTEWWPATGSSGLENIRGVVFLVCGLGEHTGRYDSVALRLNQEGFAVFGLDNQGSGGSEGVRLYVERFQHFVDDIQLFITAMLKKYPFLDSTSVPRFLLGHSMGGLIATHVALRDPSFFTGGVILSGPGFASPAANPGPLLRAIARFLSNYMPKFPVKTLNASLVSHNVPVVQLVKQDPYYSNDKLRARFAEEFLTAQEEVFDKMYASTFPFLIVHGEDDQLCSVAKARQFCHEARSEDKEMKTYPGAAHEVLTEVCRERVMEDVMTFINTHVQLN